MDYELLDKEIESAAIELIGKLREHGLMFSTAESCTAGMIAARMGDFAGVSDVLCGGVVSYSNEVKMRVLGVPEEVLASVGAVSEKCAKYMAEGSRRACGSDIAVSVTGIAGPGGGTDEKPVGTVCFGVATPVGTRTETVHFPADASRGEIRRLTVKRAFELSLEEIKASK